MRVAVYFIEMHTRSTKVAQAMAAGIRKMGDTVILRNEREHRHVDADIAVFYGYISRLPKILEDYRAAQKPVVYLDLGYWNRREGGRFSGYHKVSVNTRHPTAYFQKVRHPRDRVLSQKIAAAPWRKRGEHILLAGMSEKAAWSCGYQAEEWERSAVAALKKATDRPIFYRPKPSWTGARPIEGTQFCPGADELDGVLRHAHAVVTHHSNVSVDALVAGIPAFCVEGVAAPLAKSDLAAIEAPLFPEDRDQWLADVAYCQWSVQEMYEGKPWIHLKQEGLIL